MGHDWKPGQVALVDSWRGEGQLAFRCQRGEVTNWCVFDGTDVRGLDDVEVLASRPVAVIDYGDREHLERLATLLANHGAHGRRVSKNAERWAISDALREFAAPTPPRPDEPTGLGAVVEDKGSDLWVKCEGDKRFPWCRATPDGSEWTSYDQIDVTRVLSEGVQP